MTADTGFRYRPGLDGVRALAVAAVILYHGEVSWMKGGFLGVDVFFVLSGYLITSLLLVERERTGRLDLVAFWTRRARRLLPALLLLLAGVALYAAVWAQPTELSGLRADGFASLLYASNWRFVLDGQSYFQLFQAPSPLAHTWSLAIEEQWYLLWPIALLLLMRVCRTRPKLVTALIGGLALCSAALMAILFHPGADPSRVYYGTDTRAQALLVGAAFAALTAGRHSTLRLERLRRPWVLQAVGLLGLAVVVVMMLRVDATGAFLYRGGFLLVALAAIAFIAATSVDGPLAAVFSVRPLRLIGAISYGLYLWHWPVDVVLDETRTGLDGVALLATRVAVTFAIAGASFVLVERPIRANGLAWFRSRPRARPAVVFVAGALVAALLAVSTLGGVAAPSASAFLRSPKGKPAVADRSRSRVLMLGDSQMFSMTFYDKVLSKSGPQFAYDTILGCGVFDPSERVGGPCDKRASNWAADVQSFNPDLSVLLIGAWETLDFTLDGHRFVHATPEHERALVAIITAALDTLAARGGHVALLEVPCHHATQRLDASSLRIMNDPPSIANVNDALREVANNAPDRVTFVPWADTICPGGRYVQEIGGVDVRPDGMHFHSAEAASIATRPLAPVIRRLARDAHAGRRAARS